MNIEVTTDFRNAVLYGLMKKEDEDVLVFDKKHHNYAKSIAAVKIIIDQSLDREHGFILEFNSDYTRLRKRNIVDYSLTTVKILK